MSSSNTSSACGTRLSPARDDHELSFSIKCGPKTEEFYPCKFKRIGKGLWKCIKHGNNWYNPNEFEALISRPAPDQEMETNYKVWREASGWMAIGTQPWQRPWQHSRLCSATGESSSKEESITCHWLWQQSWKSPRVGPTTGELWNKKEISGGYKWVQ